LEVIGEKWSLLIVRDLLMGPQRFTDLARYLGKITPKWLTLRLRDLEAAGIVERESQPGRREVWYRLTARGQELRPVVEALAVWGLDHAIRPPLPGEPVHPERALQTMTIFRNRRNVRLQRPARWSVRFAGDGVYTLVYDGARWSYHAGEEAADLVVETTPEDWVNFLLAPAAERAARARSLVISGDETRLADFHRSFDARDASSSDALGSA